MLYMQIGREIEARALFDAAFDADPFNVRADNMRRVLKHLGGYEQIRSKHFQVSVLPGQDDLLGKYMSRYLESVYPELTSRFGYEPPTASKIAGATDKGTLRTNSRRPALFLEGNDDETAATLAQIGHLHNRFRVWPGKGKNPFLPDHNRFPK